MTTPETLAAPAASGEVAADGRDLRVLTVLFLVQVSFGAFHVVGKAVLRDMAPFALAGIRVGLVAPLLAVLAWRTDRVLPRPRDLPILALLGGLGVFANQLLFITGLERTTATNAAILMVSIPVLTAAMAALLRVERIGPGRLLGVLLAVAGALVLLHPTRFTLNDRVTAGNALLLANCVCYSLFLVLQRPVLDRLPWRTVIAWAFLFGGAGVLAVAWPAVLALRTAPLPAATWWGVTYIVLFPTAFAYSLSTWAIRRSSPALVAASNTLQPLVAAALAAAFLGERLGWPQAIGFALIAAGLWRVSARQG